MPRLDGLGRALMRAVRLIRGRLRSDRITEVRRVEPRLSVAEPVRPARARVPHVAERFGEARASGLGGRAARAAEQALKSAERRGLALLGENLTPAQCAQYAEHRYFDVIGGDTGRRYRVHYGRQMNIDELDRDDKLRWRWCFVPAGNLVAGDVMLAQKVALELFESEALRVANRFPVPPIDPSEPYDALTAAEHYRRHYRIFHDQ
jgi:hypothetical protein